MSTDGCFISWRFIVGLDDCPLRGVIYFFLIFMRFGVFLNCGQRNSINLFMVGVIQTDFADVRGCFCLS